MSWSDWRVWLGCGAAICGAAFLGYCVYFDKKRRSDPDYRKRVMEKRKKQKSRQDFPVSEGTEGPVGPGGDVIDLRDPQARKEFLMQQMKLANQKMLENNLPEAISHLINFVSLSGNPQEALAALQQSLPPTIFQLLVQTISKLGEEHRTSGKGDEPD